MKSSDKKPPRKSYKAPVLHVYGDIRKVTKSLSTASKQNDAMSSSATKT